MSDGLDQIKGEQAAEQALGELIAGDDDAASAAERRIEAERAESTKHEAPKAWREVRDQDDAGRELADVVSGRSRKPVGDDDVAAYLAKYGGDTDKALRAAVHAQRLIGEKGSEIGHLKKQLEGQAPGDGTSEYDDLLYDDEQPAYTAPDMSQFSSYEELEDAVYTAMEEDAAQAVALAQRSGNAELYEDAMSSWYDEDPRAAARYERQVEYAQLEQQRQAYDHYQIVSQSQLAEAYENASTGLRDFGKYEQKMSEIAASPEGMALMAGLTANTVQAKERVIRGLYALARGDASNSEEALSVSVPHVATAQTVPNGPMRARNQLLDGMNREAEQLARVSEMWAEGTRQAGKR